MQVFYRKRQERPGSLVAYSVRYVVNNKIIYIKKRNMGRTNICEIHLKNELVLYLAIDGRESFKEALNQIVFFNLSILIICKITYG